MISLRRWIVMKEVVLPWVLKDMLDLTDRRGQGGRAFQEERTDQPKQRCGVQRIHSMFRGYEYPIGAAMWNILGGHWGAGGGGRTAKVGGPSSCRS